MLKKVNPDILIGLLLASLFWVGVFVWQSSQPPKHTSAASQHCEGTKSECAKTTTDERIADYTWWLAVLTAGLVCSGVIQFGFLIRSDNTASIAANAADLSARAAIALELPLIRASNPKFGTSDVQDTTGAKRYTCYVNQLFFYNHGRTRASPIEVQIGLTIGDKLPKEPIYLHIKSFSPNVIMEPNPAAFFEANFPEFNFDRPPDLWKILHSKSTNLWFYCNLVYLDFMDTRREASRAFPRFESYHAAFLSL
jgi:hypothetical protein